MTKAQTLAALGNQLDSFYSLEQVIKIVETIEPEVTKTKVFGINQETLDRISEEIGCCLDRRSHDLVDNDSAEFEINYDNRIELSSADVRVDVIMEHVNACLEKFLMEEDEFTPFEEETLGFRVTED
jgi:hypothetical protein